MKLKRGVTILLVALSLVCCAGTTVLWIRSNQWWDTYVWRRPAHGLGIRSAGARIVINVKQTDRVHELPTLGFSSERPKTWWLDSTWVNDDPLYTDLNFASMDTRQFCWETFKADPWYSDRVKFTNSPSLDDDYLRIRFPHWLLVAFTGVAPLAMALRSVSIAAQRRYRARHGRCTGCGYDLRASADRCPECGRVAPSELRIEAITSRRSS